MTKLLGALFFMLAFATAAEAQDTIKPILGFSQGAVNFGVDYEHGLSSSTGIGGYFLYSAKDDDTSKPQTISFGGFMPIHFTDSNLYFDTYIAPGFGLTMVDNKAPTSDTTVLGPSIKVGFLYRLTATTKVGMDHIQLVNWFSDKASANYSYTNAAMTFAF